jgi:hypothetical protein
MSLNPFQLNVRECLVAVLLGILVFVGIGLIYYGLRTGFPPVVQVLLPIVYVGLVVSVVRGGGISIPERYRRPLLGGRIYVLELAKSLGLFCASLLWVASVIRLVNNTPAGAAAVFIPGLILLGLSAFFFWRSFSRPSV